MTFSDPDPALDAELRRTWRELVAADADVERGARRLLARANVPARRTARTPWTLLAVGAGVGLTGVALAFPGVVRGALDGWAFDESPPHRSSPPRGVAAVRPPEPISTAPVVAPPLDATADAQERPPVARVAAPAATPRVRPRVTALRGVSGDEDADWQQVTEALRSGAIAEAERILSRLSAGPDRAEADAARLARAELWIRMGQAERARILLRELAEVAATPSQRRQARASLAGLGEP